MTCLECEKRSPWVCASNPLKVECPITLEYHTLDHECNIVETKGEEMNEVWKKIFEKHIKSFEAIEYLCAQDILLSEQRNLYCRELLLEIISDMRSEVVEK